MRVCIQKLVPLLKQDGNSLNDYISSLVRKGLELEIQQSMEVLQVLQNDQGSLPISRRKKIRKWRSDSSTR
jgi:hypothetical protein